MTTLYIVRHVQAQGNLLDRFQGVTDGEVTDIGRKQLEALTAGSQGWHDPIVIFSSPLTRAMQTALAVRKNYNCPVLARPGLIEINCGDWENQSWTDIQERFPESYAQWVNDPAAFVAPHGESMQQAYDRITATIDKLVRQIRGETLIISTHAAVLRCYLSYVEFGTLARIQEVGWGDNAAINQITFDDDFKPTLVYKYDNRHLPEEISTSAIRRRLKQHSVGAD